jgi:hypothetical protein
MRDAGHPGHRVPGGGWGAGRVGLGFFRSSPKKKEVGLNGAVEGGKGKGKRGR